LTAWVVVGAGSAGCVVAGRLAEAGHAVTLVEAGPATPARSADCASYFDALAEPGRTYDDAPTRGRGLGGSGAINGMLATRGDHAQYRAWGWDDVEDAFGRIRVPLEQVGDDELGPVDRALLAAAPDAERATLTRHAGRRVTAADAYLGDAAVEIVGDAPVTRLTFDGTLATGAVLAGGRFVECDRVAIAAGVIGTPTVLRASGIDLPRLELRNHAALPVTLRVRQDVDVHSLVTGSLLRRGDIQVVALNHLGPDAPAHGMLLVAAMTRAARLDTGLALVRELLAHAAFRDLIDHVDVGSAGEGIFHFTSTCAMGVVVDGDGLVAGTQNVHVVDASAFPDIPATNTYLPTLMFAERFAARRR
jgi:choline dehydrogenase-like flavoprotein